MAVAQAEVAVAATKSAPMPEENKSPTRLGHAILAAALSMPCLQAQAETVPEQGYVSYKYLDYRETQLGEDRVKVGANTLAFMTPFAGQWSVQAAMTVDTVSGASPRLWSRSAASMSDKRKVKDLALTRYFDHDTLTLAAGLSDENDYRSEYVSFTGTHSTEDKNTTFHYAAGLTQDKITSQGLDENKRKVDWVLGVTQVLTRKDIVQLMLTDGRGKGFFTDPYKFVDIRPDTRNQKTMLVRWNHFFEDFDSTVRLSYRYYDDSWKIKAHTIGVEYVQPLADGWTVVPSVRLHDQSAAEFYVDPADFPSPARYHSEDQRLSAFGARTYGLKVVKLIDTRWTVDLKYEKYMQHSSWRMFGSGSPDIDPFKARMLQLGVTYRF